jgi:Flp pilus assembly protein TadG
MPWEHRESTVGSDRGVAAVETALVSMLLVILLAGIVDSSFLFKDWLAVSAAARAGARMGSSQPRSASFAQDSADQVTNAISGLTPANLLAVWVYKTTGATGPPPASCTSTTSCVPFTWNGTQLTTTFSANWPSTSQNACAGDAARDSLGVYLKYQHTSPLRFFFNNQIMSESTVMWIEPISSSLICKP